MAPIQVREPIVLHICQFLKEEGYLTADSIGMASANANVQWGGVGILWRPPIYGFWNRLYARIMNPLAVFIGYIDCQNESHLRFLVYGREHLELARMIAETIQSKFGVAITLFLDSEESREEYRTGGGGF
ncbi:MAG: hypothetical protein Q8P82_01780 [bacterium]|nr:hypothetical protein [bacterium]